MKIREAKIKDIDEILSIGNKIGEFRISEGLINFWPRHILQNCIKSKTDLLIVAEKEYKIIGFIVVNYNNTFKKAIIENIYIVPKFRKRGIAKQLLDIAIEKVISLKCEYICALTNNKEAIDFYKRSGFEKGNEFAWLGKIISKKFISIK